MYTVSQNQLQKAVSVLPKIDHNLQSSNVDTAEALGCDSSQTVRMSTGQIISVPPPHPVDPILTAIFSFHQSLQCTTFFSLRASSAAKTIA